ncbi:MAG: hypothetical protein B6U85_05115 [Desulfurococcales archaeon ex4484_42]|nr:MAG: hypothetical protein B6U85_05115 [Desulfurococcales archaeon ex4484_42]
MSIEVIDSLVKKYEDEIVEFLRNLIKAKSYNPPGNEAEVVNVIIDKLKEVGIKYEVLEPAPNRSNLIFNVNLGSGPILLFNGHTDVVPPGDLSKWKYDPLSAVVINGKIYGRGATDMKGGLASMIMSIILYLRSESLVKNINGRIVMVASADEEMNSDYGLKYLVKVRRESLIADYAIVGEPTGMSNVGKAIIIGEKGDYEVHVKIYGKKAHSSVPFLGVNAVELACNFVHNLRRLKLPKVKSPISKLDLIKQFINRRPKAMPGRPKGSLLQYLKTITETIYSVTMIRGGFKGNVIPDECEVVIDFRVIPGHKSGDVVNAVKKLLNDLGINKFNIEVPIIFEPSVLKNGDDLVNVLKEGVKVFYGHDPIVTLAPGASDARILRNILGVKTIVFGPGNGELAHSDNEYIEINDVLNSTKVYMYTISKLLSKKEKS